MKCPYCGGKLKNKVSYRPLSVKRREVLDFILAAGPEGISYKQVLSKVLPGRSRITLRTMIYYINKAIAPMRIQSRGGILRFTEK